jgi:hypothetical protein
MVTIDELTHIGDIFAVPLFALGIYYFYKIKNKKLIEVILLLFCIIGFMADFIFTISYYKFL